MKVAVISINTSWNVVNFRTGLIRALQADGFEIVVIAPRDGYTDKFVSLGVCFNSIEIDSKGSSPLRDLHLLWSYYRLLRRISPDIFLSFTSKPNIYGSIAAKALRIPVIANVSGLGTAFIMGGWLGQVVSKLYLVAFRRVETVFFQNSEDRALFIKKRLVSELQARILPGSGIDTGRFKPSSATRAISGFVFLLPARLLWDKGVGEFVAAARMIREVDPTVRFQILGFLDIANRTAVSRADVEAWVGEGVVEYLGPTDDVRPFMAAADCVVLPSYREGLPRSLLEAASMGRPLIATDAPGCRDIVRNGYNGFQCKVRDAASLAETMRRMMGLTDEQRRELGAAGRLMAVSEFDETIVIERYRAAVSEALCKYGHAS